MKKSCTVLFAIAVITIAMAGLSEAAPYHSDILTGLLRVATEGREINEWLATVPGIKPLSKNAEDWYEERTYTYSGECDKIADLIREKLKSLKWTISKDSSTAAFSVETISLKAARGKGTIAISISRTPATATMVNVVTDLAGSQGESSSSPGGRTTAAPEDTGKNSTSLSSAVKGNEISGNVVNQLEGNYVVPSGKKLNLMATLRGSLTVSKGASATIMAPLEGNVTNYGTLVNTGTIEGDVTTIGGKFQNMGHVKGRISSK
ncbi:MAG: hypothetical protein RDV48_01075 [Candidatus Eremiobacteraeota bacterium]|nr:hypothetical protein [Candidatus Eremiobacteraeota bacterium]